MNCISYAARCTHININEQHLPVICWVEWNVKVMTVKLVKMVKKCKKLLGFYPSFLLLHRRTMAIRSSVFSSTTTQRMAIQYSLQLLVRIGYVFSRFLVLASLSASFEVYVLCLLLHIHAPSTCKNHVIFFFFFLWNGYYFVVKTS